MATRRSSSADFLAVLICSAVFSAGGWALWRDLTSFIKPAGGEPVGTLVFKRRTAQRKYSDRAIWEELPDRAVLYSYDSIRTAADSEAKLLMNDGTEISLEESTLILLDYGQGSRNIEFIAGNITAARTEPAPARAEAPGQAGGATAATPPPVTISSKGSKVEVKAESRASLAVSDKGTLDVAVAKGAVDLVLAGQKQEVKENEKALVHAEAKTATVERIPVTLSSPAYDSIWLSYRPETEIPVAWTSEKPQTEYTLELSRAASFQPLLESRLETSSRSTLKLPAGSYYLRISIDQGQAGRSVSQATRFTVLSESEPVPVAPQDGASFSYRSKPPSLRFIWEGAAAASSYELEIAHDADFTDIARRLKADSPFAVAEGLEEGVYWWRVRPIYAFKIQGEAPRASRPASFSVARIAELAATEALAPREGETVLERVLNQAGLRFSWKSAPEAVMSTLTIARDAAMADVVIRSETKATYLEINSGLSPGNYWWQVSSQGADGTPAPPSEPRSFTVSSKLPSIARLSPADGAEMEAIPGSGLRFGWESDGASGFAFELARDRGFTDPLRRETGQSSLEIKDLSPGQYYWRVSALGPEGIQLASSPIQALSVLGPLAAPKPLSPQAGQVLDLVNAEGMDFSWGASPEADSYAFRLLAQDGRVIAESTALKETSLRFQDMDSLKPESYRWEVQAFQQRAGRQRSSVKASSAFSVVRNARIGPPQLLEPADGAILGELDIKRTGITFSWKRDPLAPSNRFTLARDPGFREIISQQTIDGTTASFKRLEPGDYYWNVTGLAEDGKIYASGQRSLTIRKAPPLNDPAVVWPTRGERVEMAERDSLPFSWKPVQDASHYSVSLISRKTGETVGSAERIKPTRWEFSDLAKLDVGAFAFTIQALTIDQSGAVERRSSVVTVDFSIKLTMRIGDPEILSPDIFYLE